MTTAETSAGVLPEMADVPAAELRVAVLGVGLMGADHVARLHSRGSLRPAHGGPPGFTGACHGNRCGRLLVQSSRHATGRSP